MTDPKIHRLARTADVDGMGWTMCGRLDPLHRMRGQTEGAEVTCRNCLKALDASPGFTAADVARPDWVAPPPKPMRVTDSRWGDMPARIRRIAEQGTGRQRKRPRWGSPEEAARWVAAIRADGYSSTSASGAVERIGQAGTRVQTSGRSVNRCTRQALDVADVGKAFKAARARVDLPDGVTYEVAVAVWADHKVGRPLTADEWNGRTREERTHFAAEDAATVARRHGLDVGSVVAVALEVHRALYAEMRDRGLCPGGGVRR